MKNTLKSAAGSAAALLMTASLGAAAGLDRSGQDISIIFQPGRYMEFSFGQVEPTVTGTDPFGAGTGDVANNFQVLSGGFKLPLSAQLDAALILETPFGADVAYPVIGTSPMLGGTMAQATSDSLTAILRYKMENGFSIHGGLRFQQVQGDITLAGAAYGGLSGYNVSLLKDNGTGFLVGGAYERPAIALRVAVTYFSHVVHEMETVETHPGLGPDPFTSTTTVKTPEAVNINIQSGIARNTLVFLNARYAWWSQTIIGPDGFRALTGNPDGSLTDMNDNWSVNVGIGRRFTPRLSGSASYGWEPKTGKNVSPLSPSNGQHSISLGMRFQASETVSLSAGVRFTRLGDAVAAPGGVPVDPFTDNHVVSAGFKIGVNF